jgi:hypothetical protein
MAEINIYQRPLDVISPTLKDSTTSPSGHYYVQNIWQVDATSLLPLGTSQAITFPS